MNASHPADRDLTSEVLLAGGDELAELLPRSAARDTPCSPAEAAALRASPETLGLVVLRVADDRPMVVRAEDLSGDAVVIVAWLLHGEPAGPGGPSAPSAVLLALTMTELRALRTTRVPVGVAQRLYEAGSALLDEE